MQDELADAAGIAALGDPLRRQLYRYVARSASAVGREETAAAVGVPVHTAKFHLDRMVEDGLLEVEYRRLSGRTGPGAGRPAKLYRRSDREFSVSLPDRRYDVLSRILADAVATAVERGVPVADVVADVARRHGVEFGAERSATTGAPLDRLAQALEDGGYEPRVSADRMVLENCPFDQAAREHRDLVCGMNLDFVDGVLDGLGCHGVSAALEPGAGRCCVSAQADAASP